MKKEGKKVIWVFCISWKPSTVLTTHETATDSVAEFSSFSKSTPGLHFNESYL
jgi:hypothetical protein